MKYVDDTRLSYRTQDWFTYLFWHHVTTIPYGCNMKCRTVGMELGLDPQRCLHFLLSILGNLNMDFTERREVFQSKVVVVRMATGRTMKHFEALHEALLFIMRNRGNGTVAISIPWGGAMIGDQGLLGHFFNWPFLYKCHNILEKCKEIKCHCYQSMLEFAGLGAEGSLQFIIRNSWRVSASYHVPQNQRNGLCCRIHSTNEMTRSFPVFWKGTQHLNSVCTTSASGSNHCH